MVSNVNDEFLVRGGFIFFVISGVGLSSGGLRKRYSIVVLSILLLEVRFLKISSSFIVFGGCVEEKLIVFVSKVIDEE